VAYKRRSIPILILEYPITIQSYQKAPEVESLQAMTADARLRTQNPVIMHA
jgi:hypothetical protein